MINKVILEGRLTKDLDLRKTTSGLSVCSFTLAVNRRKQQDGTQLADYPQVQAWRSSADFLANYAKKGTLISVVGRLQTRNYEGNDGKKVYVTEVVADEVAILSQPKESTEQYQSNNEEEYQENGFEINSDDLPFY